MADRSWIPNTLTGLNLFFGCAALALLASYNFVGATWCVFLAALLDLLDGMTARLLCGGGSALGKQLDALADVVSFGVVPGMTLFFLVEKYSFCCNLSGWAFELYLVWISCLCVPVFAALRLARFVEAAEDLHYFRGLPTPAVGLFVTCLPMMIHREALLGKMLEDYLLHTFSFLGIALGLSGLMISRLPLMTLKFSGNPFRRATVFRLVFVIASLLLILGLHHLAALPILLLYLLLSGLEYRLMPWTEEDRG